MAWTERQRAMLGAMGLRVWTPAAAAAAAPAQGADGVDGVVGGGDSAEAHTDVALSASLQTAAPSRTSSRTPLAQTLTPPSGPPSAPPSTLSPAPAARPAAVPAAITIQQPPSSLRGHSAEGLNWDALRNTVANCRACGLCESRSQTVFGVGHPQAHWMVVGEAPGEQEDREGEPFVGAAGQLLDRMLAALQLTRAQDGPRPPSQRVYIANTLKCRPPRNRNPAPDEMARCEPYLVRQIELLRPRIILAMGAFAVKALLRSELPVGKLRGQVHRYQGVPLVVTYHPAYLLRSLQEKAKAWDDLCLAASVAEAAEAADAPAMHAQG